MTLAKKLAITVRISESEDSIKRFSIAGLFVTIFSNPAGYTFNIPSSILIKSLNDGDFNQNPNVSFWHKDKTCSCRSLGFEMSWEKNLTKDEEDKHF